MNKNAAKKDDKLQNTLPKKLRSKAVTQKMNNTEKI